MQHHYPSITQAISHLIGTRHPKINEKSVLSNCFISGYVLVPRSFVLNLSIFFLSVLSINQLITIPPICFQHTCSLQKYPFRSISKQNDAGKISQHSLLGIISSFTENNIPEKGYNRFIFLIFATDKVYNGLSGVCSAQ